MINIALLCITIIAILAGLYWYLYIRNGRYAHKQPDARKKKKSPNSYFYKPQEGVGIGLKQVFVTTHGLRSYSVDENNFPVIPVKESI
jgi:hypothetical protein